MITIRQYRPAYFEGFEDSTTYTEQAVAIREIAFVKNFEQAPGFHRFSISASLFQHADLPVVHHLMAEYKEGYEWWVVASIPGGDPAVLEQLLAEFPKWEAKYKDKEQ